VDAHFSFADFSLASSTLNHNGKVRILVGKTLQVHGKLMAVLRYIASSRLLLLAVARDKMLVEKGADGENE